MKLEEFYTKTQSHVSHTFKMILFIINFDMREKHKVYLSTKLVTCLLKNFSILNFKSKQ
jgi:hypothetical protein